MDTAGAQRPPPAAQSASNPSTPCAAATYTRVAPLFVTASGGSPAARCWNGYFHLPIDAVHEASHTEPSVAQPVGNAYSVFPSRPVTNTEPPATLGIPGPSTGARQSGVHGASVPAHGKGYTTTWPAADPYFAVPSARNPSPVAIRKASGCGKRRGRPRSPGARGGA